MGICFLVFFRSLRPFDALNEGTKEKAYPSSKYPGGHPNELPHTHSCARG